METESTSYLSVTADRIITGECLPCDIFAKGKGIYTMLFNKGMYFSPAAREILERQGIAEVHIRARDIGDFESYLAERTSRSISFGDDPAVFRRYSQLKGRHFQIDRALLLPGRQVDFGLFLLDRFDISPLAGASGGLPVPIDDAILSARGDIMIKESDIPRYAEYLGSFAKPCGIPEKDGVKMRAVALKENAKIVMRGLFKDPRNAEGVKKAKDMVNAIVDCVLGNRELLHDMLSLKTYDYYLYTHSVNVAVLSIGLGASIGLKRDSIEKLGTGAILHDLGKGLVPLEILNRQGKLSDPEYRTIRSHVVEGEKILREHRDIGRECLSVVLQHHEKLSGKGYPFKLAGDTIKTFGRITAITDCYDALSTRRPFRPPFAPFYALSILAKESGDYDPEILKTFIKMLGNADHGFIC